jgi:hypothetical protein
VCSRYLLQCHWSFKLLNVLGLLYGNVLDGGFIKLLYMPRRILLSQHNFMYRVLRWLI